MTVVKTNEQCSIRTATLEDAESTLAIQKFVISEGNYLISLAEEFKKTPEQQREWIKEVLESQTDTMIVAEVDGEVVGWIVFISNKRIRTAHTGTFGIMISPAYRNMGIGRKLVQALLEWAEENPIIEKVSLGVFSTNQRAIALYRRLGFIEEGRKVKDFKIAEDEYIDDILMYKLVKGEKK